MKNISDLNNEINHQGSNNREMPCPPGEGGYQLMSFGGGGGCKKKEEMENKKRKGK
jgi:hypothetical protein